MIVFAHQYLITDKLLRISIHVYHVNFFMPIFFRIITRVQQNDRPNS